MNNPTSAVKTANNITRGFVSAMKSGRRAIKRGHGSTCERGTGIAVVFITNAFQRQGLLSQDPQSLPVHRFMPAFMVDWSQHTAYYPGERQCDGSESRNPLHAGGAGRP
jgi:hypothetical protein